LIDTGEGGIGFHKKTKPQTVAVPWAGLDFSHFRSAALTSLDENSVVPPGLGLFLSLYPALKRRAIGEGPSGTHVSFVPELFAVQKAVQRTL